MQCTWSLEGPALLRGRRSPGSPEGSGTLSKIAGDKYCTASELCQTVATDLEHAVDHEDTEDEGEEQESNRQGGGVLLLSCSLDVPRLCRYSLAGTGGHI